METEDGEVAMMRQASSQYYHIFRNGVCYEFELGLGTAGFGAVDGLKQVDGDDVFRKLTSCEEGQPLYPGQYCDIDFSYAAGRKTEICQVPGPDSKTRTQRYILPVPITGAPDFGAIVVTTNASDIEPANGRVSLIAHPQPFPNSALRFPLKLPPGCS